MSWNMCGMVVCRMDWRTGYFFMNLVMSLKNIAGREDKSVKWLRSRREERTGRNGSGTLLWLCEKRNDKSV